MLCCRIASAGNPSASDEAAGTVVQEQVTHALERETLGSEANGVGSPEFVAPVVSAKHDADGNTSGGERQDGAAPC